MQHVLIVTHQKGFEADRVIDELRRRGVPFFRLNTDFGDNRSLISWDNHYNLGETIFFSCDNKVVESRQLGVGWFQQPPPFLGEPRNSRQNLEMENLWALQLGVFEILDIPWLNAPNCIFSASNKLVQLQVANKVGFRVLPTLISNSPGHIREFCLNYEVAAKNLSTPWHVVDGAEQAAYTKLVRREWLENDEDISFSPVIYQVFCHRRKDIRVVAVGDKFFSVDCIQGTVTADVRWGRGTGDGFSVSEIDDGTKTKITSFMNKLGINYASVDLIEDMDGNIYFLEANTCGAWWWVDKFYEGKICNTIVDFLIGTISGNNPETSL